MKHRDIINGSRLIPRLGGWMCLIALGAWTPAVTAGIHETRLDERLDRGEYLLGELQCLACHQARPRVQQRVGLRGGPVLGRDGLTLSPAWIRAWLENPQAMKPGTAMPDSLHGLASPEKAEAVDALVHYLVSVQPETPPEPWGAETGRMKTGRELYHGLGCVACHAPEDRPEGMDEPAFRSLREKSVPLGALDRKYPAGELIRFLQDPVRHRPAGRMPSLNLTEREAAALATYLLRGQVPSLTDPGQTMKTLSGWNYEYFEGSFGGCADMDRMQAIDSGEVREIDLGMKRREQGFGVRFHGVLEIREPGEYQFWLRSDDGSVLMINGQKVVDNDGEHGPQDRRGRVSLEAGLHDVDLRFYQNAGGYEFAVTWSGPGFRRQPIPAAVMKRYGEPMTPLDGEGLEIDPVKVAQGREWYGQLQCGACHALRDPDMTTKPARLATPWNDLALVAAKGCLADAVPANAPRYALTGDQREALRATVRTGSDLARPLSPALQVAMTLDRLNCTQCHERDGVGGAEALGRSPWMELVGEADLGEEGRIPPSLSGVGGKLRPEWIRRVLEEGVKVRPYMGTRMPVYGVVNTGALPGALGDADLQADALPEPVVTARDAKFGHVLVGREGLSCISCHTFSTHGSTGIPGLALDVMHERLRWDWFRRYLPDPAALRPGTRMPSFWPDQVAVNTDLLQGDTEAQIRSIWAWLADGARADVPAGLIRARMEIVPETGPVIYRNFIAGAGPRAIGVGYPERGHLAWDAEHMRLALLWQGSFIDMSRHSTDRGVGFEPPLGDRVLQFGEGPDVVQGVGPDEPWPTRSGRALGHRFQGYELDDARRPRFRYLLPGGTVQVTESFTPERQEVDVRFVRKWSVTGVVDQPVWIRVLPADAVQQADGSWLWKESVRVRARGGRVVRGEGEWRMELDRSGRQGEAEVEWVW